MKTWRKRQRKEILLNSDMAELECSIPQVLKFGFQEEIKFDITDVDHSLQDTSRVQVGLPSNLGRWLVNVAFQNGD